MNRLLSTDLWPTVSKLSKNAVKQAAIAYVSSDEHLRFGDGDLLVCDASTNAIKSGQTSAAVLKRAYERNARLFSIPNLHAKIILINEKAIIGSANASGSSASNLIEAGLLTDQPTIVAEAQSFVNQLARQAEELSERRLRQLLAIKVVRRQPPRNAVKINVKVPQKHRTWIIGTTELTKEFEKDHALVEEAAETSRSRLSDQRSNVLSLQWTGTSRFRDKCRKGDWLIQLWRPAGKKNPTVVYERMPVLDRRDSDSATYFFYQEYPKDESRAKTWTDFKKLTVRAGINRKLTPGSQFEITESQANTLGEMWKD